MNKKRALSALLSLALCAAMCVPALAAGPTFSDVPASHWAYTAIEKAAGNGMVAGVGGGKYDPNGAITGGQLLAMLTRHFCPEDIETDPIVLSQAGHSGRWYSGNLYAALKHGYLDGIDPTEIDLDAPCTREQMVTILYNVAGKPATNTSALAQFNDRGQVAAYAVNGFSWAVSNKVVSGTSNTTLSPRGTATRAQVAVILIRYLENVEGVQFPEVNGGSTQPVEPKPTPTPTKPDASNSQNSDGTTNAAYVNSLCDVGKSNDYPTTGDASSPNANGFYTKANVDISGAKLQYDVIPYVNAFLAKHSDQIEANKDYKPWDVTMHWVTTDEQEEYTLLRAKEAYSYFEHKRPNGDSINSAENLYRGNSGAEVVIKAWENSSGHASTMLGAGYEDATVCVASYNGVWVMTLWGDQLTSKLILRAPNNYFK
ncbi:S-layer homology domain-containing protein [Colidextribacter sp. 210702-DFI.3.9]|nr:S-layer homology domain-containing protein [Colidextribacter sp. 210702-DFI.3.9]